MKINHMKANLLMQAEKWDMTLAEVAKEAGYSKQELNNMFYRQSITSKNVLDLANVLGVEPEELTKEVSPEEYGVKMADPRNRVKENLRMIAAEFGLTFSTIIKGVGLTEPVFRKAFRINYPREDVIEKICQYLDIDEEELTGKIDYERYGEALIPRIKER